MDEINDFFDFSKDFQRKVAPRGCISGNIETTVSNPEDSRDLVKRQQSGTDYAAKVVEKECVKLEQVCLDHLYKLNSKSL